jgi:hypothetical protein
MLVVYKTISARLPAGRFLRALVLSFLLMGLGAEVQQLSVSGNVFWMMVGVCLALRSHSLARYAQMRLDWTQPAVASSATAAV